MMQGTPRTLHALCALALVTLLYATSSRGAIMAVDLGSEYLKISMVKPGRIPISIVNNEMSKRKSPAAVAFINGDRLVGDEAASMIVRYPDRVITRLRDLLGKRYGDADLARLVQESRLAFPIVAAPNRSTVAVQTDNGEVYTAEELVASLLEYAKRLATAAADGDTVTDCVLVVPPFWGPIQRRALLDAAHLAGLNVMSLVHGHAAAALHYGIERDFTNKTEDVVFYDIGASSVEAALVRFSSYAVKGSNTTVSQFEVRDMAWVEHGVGCDALEAALVTHFAAKHHQGSNAVLSVPRAVAKLRRQVKRTKEVLSANANAPVIVEELLPGEDFKATIQREEFEELAERVWERAVAPLTAILSRNNISEGDLSAVELLGGCSRVPKLKSAMSEVLNGRALDMHMDADEAVVLGAGYFAANLSTIFRLRKFGMTDKAPYQITFALDSVTDEALGDAQQDGAEAATKERVLVPVLRRIPTKRAITLQNITEDSFSVALNIDIRTGAALSCCQKQELLGTFNVSNISSVITKYGYSGKVALHTSVDQGGVFKIDRADASIEIEEEIKPKAKASSKANATADEHANVNSTAPEISTMGAHEAEGPEEAGNSTTTTPVEEENSADLEQEVPRKTKQRTIRVPLPLSGGFSLPGLTADELWASRRVLRMLRERDETKRATAKARNDLESYIISTRESLNSREDLREVSTEEQREVVLNALSDAEDWLYGDGDSEQAPAYRNKLMELKKKMEPIESRAAEVVARPGAIKSAEESIELTLKVANSWPELKPWLNATDVASFEASVREFKEWLKGRIEAQEAVAPYDDPAVTVGDIAKRTDLLRKSFMRLNTKPKPIVKKPKPVVNATEGSNDTIPETMEVPANETAAGDENISDAVEEEVHDEL